MVKTENKYNEKRKIVNVFSYFLLNTEERAEISKEYFDKLLITEEPKELIKIGNREINEVEELTT